MAESEGLARYQRLLADRPGKLTASESGYTPPARNQTDYFCDECLHFYTGKAARRTVCEIVRLQPERSIEPKAKCRFWTRTGEKFPLLRTED